jgi:hypothetical protein
MVYEIWVSRLHSDIIAYVGFAKARSRMAAESFNTLNYCRRMIILLSGSLDVLLRLQAHLDEAGAEAVDVEMALGGVSLMK